MRRASLFALALLVASCSPKISETFRGHISQMIVDGSSLCSGAGMGRTEFVTQYVIAKDDYDLSVAAGWPDSMGGARSDVDAALAGWDHYIYLLDAGDLLETDAQFLPITEYGGDKLAVETYPAADARNGGKKYLPAASAVTVLNIACDHWADASKSITAATK